MNSWTLAHSALAFFALAMTIISVWVKRSAWIWGSFLIFAFILGFFAKLIQPIALAPIGALLILHTFLKGDIRGMARFILFIVTFAISIGLLLQSFFPGFSSWEIINKVRLSPGGTPYSLFLNFRKPFVGIFVLALGFPLVKNLREFAKLLRIAIPLTVAGILIMVMLALSSGLIRFDPKLPNFFWFFAIESLIFVSIIEEAFWRGFVQKEIFRGFGEKGLFASVGCIVITSILFAAMHYFWVPSVPFLTLVFVASVIYGTIFQITKALEASILCHYLFNITHFLLFTYPVLQKAL